MQWVEGRLAASHAIADYLATYPVTTAAAQIAWISTALDIDPGSFTLDLAAAYRVATGSTQSASSTMAPDPRSIAI